MITTKRIALVSLLLLGSLQALSAERFGVWLSKHGDDDLEPMLTSYLSREFRSLGDAAVYASGTEQTYVLVMSATTDSNFVILSYFFLPYANNTILEQLEKRMAEVPQDTRVDVLRNLTLLLVSPRLYLYPRFFTTTLFPRADLQSVVNELVAKCDAQELEQYL